MEAQLQQQAVRPDRVFMPGMADILKYGQAPAAKLRNRVRQGEMEEDRAFLRAIDASRGIDTPLPVIFEGKHLGWLRGDGPFSPVVRYRRRRDWEKWECAITSYDGIINAFQGGKEAKNFFQKTNTTAFSVANNYYDWWAVTGNPTAGALNNTAFTAVVPTDTTTGSMWLGGDVSTDLKHVAVCWMMSSGGTPTIFMYDRCLVYDQCTFNASANQALTNSNTLTRYQNNGEGGCKIHVAVGPTLTGATAANLTQLRYTDQDGNATQSMPTTTTVTFIPSVATGTSTLGSRFIVPSTSGATVLWGPFLPMAAGDGGARLVNDYTTSAANTGNFSIVLNRVLAVCPTTAAGVTSLYDMVEQVAGFARIRDTAALTAFVYAPATTATTVNGGMQAVWG